MIEVTPFFHTMAGSIAKELAGSSDDAIIATTIVSYAISSIVTGLVFFLLGKLRLGVLVGFFPRHILVGCIGGVGYFLVATGVEVSSRLEGGLSYNFETFKYLFSTTSRCWNGQFRLHWQQCWCCFNTDSTTPCWFHCILFLFSSRSIWWLLLCRNGV